MKAKKANTTKAKPKKDFSTRKETDEDIAAWPSKTLGDKPKKEMPAQSPQAEEKNNPALSVLPLYIYTYIHPFLYSNTQPKTQMGERNQEKVDEENNANSLTEKKYKIKRKFSLPHGTQEWWHATDDGLK